MQFQRLIHTLCDAEVQFVVIGGVCATLHGSARVTYDLDICYSRSPANVRRLAAALAPFHPRPREFAEDLGFVWDHRTLSNASILTLHTDLGELDLLTEVPGLGAYDQLVARSEVVKAFGRRIMTLDLPSLIQARRAAGRPKDLAGLPELESLLEAQNPDTE